jgi:hypothetical protein
MHTSSSAAGTSARSRGRRAARRALARRHQQGPHGLAFVRDGAGEQVIEHHPEAVHVGSFGRGAVAEQLGRHEGGRSRQRAQPRAHAGLGEHGAHAGVLVVADLGDAPVEHVHLAATAHHHVLGLQIAVQHAVRVGVLHHRAHVDEHPEQTSPGDPVVARIAVVLGDELGQPPARDALHRVEQRPLAVDVEQADLVAGDDAGVLELRGDLRLVQELLGRLPRRARQRQQLHRDASPEVAVERLDDASHAAPRDLAEQHVPIRRRRGELDVGHVGPGRRSGRGDRGDRGGSALADDVLREPLGELRGFGVGGGAHEVAEASGDVGDADAVHRGEPTTSRSIRRAVAPSGHRRNRAGAPPHSRL